MREENKNNNFKIKKAQLFGKFSKWCRFLERRWNNEFIIFVPKANFFMTHRKTNKNNMEFYDYDVAKFLILCTKTDKIVIILFLWEILCFVDLGCTTLLVCSILEKESLFEIYSR